MTTNITFHSKVLAVNYLDQTVRASVHFEKASLAALKANFEATGTAWFGSTMPLAASCCKASRSEVAEALTDTLNVRLHVELLKLEAGLKFGDLIAQWHPGIEWRLTLVPQTVVLPMPRSNVRNLAVVVTAYRVDGDLLDTLSMVRKGDPYEPLTI